MPNKQKPLLPSLREKRRYIIFEVRSENKLSYDLVKEAINKKAKEFLGKLTLSRLRLIFLNDWKNERGILKVNNKYEDYIKAVFTQINDIQNQEVLVRSIGVSGTLNKSRIKYFGG